MSKRHTLVLLTLSGFLLLSAGVAFVWSQRVWLAAWGLTGSATLFLIMIALFSLLMPWELHQNRDALTSRTMVKRYLTRLTLLSAGVTAILLVFQFILYLIALPTRLGRPELTLVWLTLLIPFGISLSDLHQGKYPRTLTRFTISFALQTWRIYGQLLLIIPSVTVAFALFPAGLCLQFLSGIDLIARLFRESGLSDSTPLLCGLLNLSENRCVPALVGFHLGQPLLAVLVLFFGEQVFHKVVDWYGVSLEWLFRQLNQ
jgi:hypothetical protein